MAAAVREGEDWKMGIHGGDIYRNQIELDFSINVNPLGMSDAVREALHGAVDKSVNYPDEQAQGLVEAVSERLHVPPECLVFGNGASELFLGVVHALRPRRTVIPVPSFYGYEYAAGACNGRIDFVPMKEQEAFLPDGELLDALTEETDLLFLANPNNPTGRLLDTAYLEKILQKCRKIDTVVVLDECFLDFCGQGESMLPRLSEYENLLVVRAFTKLYAIPGVRLGYLAGAPRLVARIRQHLPEWNLSIFAQEAGIACAGQTEYAKRTAAFVRKERTLMEERLRALGVRVFPGDANFLLLFSECPLYERLLRRKILIRDCANFRGLTKGYYRVAVRGREENERLWKAIGDCIG